MFDFLKNFKKDWIPAEVLTDNTVDPAFISNNLDDTEERALAQRLADHLNTINEYTNRIDAIDYLANAAKSNFDNLTYTTMDTSLINAIIMIGGKDGTVDFFLAEDAVRLVLEWIDKTALEAITDKM